MPTSRWDVSLWDVAKWDEFAHDLTANDAEAETEVSSPAVGQEHALTANNVEAVSEVSSPTLTQVHALAANDIESVSTVSAPAVGQVHDLTPGDVEAQGEVSSPALVHVIAGEPEINPTGIGAVADFRGEEKNRKAQHERERRSADDLTRIIERAFDDEPKDEPDPEPPEPKESRTAQPEARPGPKLTTVEAGRKQIPEAPAESQAVRILHHAAAARAAREKLERERLEMEFAAYEAEQTALNDQQALELLLLVA